MTADKLKVNDWINVSKSYHKKAGSEHYELRGSEINKCFGKVQSHNPSGSNGYTIIRAMISTEDPFFMSIPYTKDFVVINKIWSVLMDQLLSKIFKND
jgi:hypothetical protein